jgi:DnaJ-domain-containing protein 1
MISHPNDGAKHALEAAFCRDVDNLLIGRLQTQADSDEAREKLARVAHLKDPKLIDQLASLGVTPAGLVAIQMVPLVLIAWADHGVDQKERACIFRQAKRFGIRQTSEAYALLDHWLDHRPPVLVFDTWRRFIRHEFAVMCSKKRATLVRITKEQMVAVARCSGGFMGLRRISSNEQKLIQAITRVLNDGCRAAQADAQTA